MKTDGRGTPGRITRKPTIHLKDLVRRKKTNMKKYLTDQGITTYHDLVKTCQNIGVQPLTEEEFSEIFPQPANINNPSEGVIVVTLEPLEIEEHTDENLDQELQNGLINLSHIVDSDLVNQPIKKNKKVRKEQ